ncbi:MAG: GntR family transcriptional regulator [Pseudomonadota bacterium]
MPALAARETLTEQIARHLGQQIITGRYPPGQKLKELEIARELDVSSNTVREAFHIVEKRHLVSIEPRRGAFVAEITPDQVRHLYDFMFMLFGELARRASTTWREGDLGEFLGLVARLGEQLKANEGPAFHATAFEFVTAALRFADNRYLEQSLIDLLPELQRCSYIAMQAETSELDVSYVLFQRIVETMLKRDADAAAAAAREYGENQCRIVLKAIGKRDR